MPFISDIKLLATSFLQQLASGGAGNGKKQYPWLKNNRPNLWIAFCRQRTEREGESSVGVEFSWCANNLCGILMLPLAEKPEY
jgi:hypothetical protein